MQTTRIVSNRPENFVEVRLGFEWEGGTYISVCENQAHGKAKEVINVEDAAGNRPEFTKANFDRLVDEWIESYGRGALIHDVTENWRYY